MNFEILITKRVRTRRLKDGVIKQARWVLNYKDPRTGRRRQEFRPTRDAAQARKAELIASVLANNYSDLRAVPTVAKACAHWLEEKASRVKPSTLATAKVTISHIVGPFLIGTREQRDEWRRTGRVPKGTKLLGTLGHIKISELTTAQIRIWHREVATLCGAYTANRARSHLKSILALAEEDFGVRTARMPVDLGTRRARQRKAILSPEQITKVIEAAQLDPEQGLYYAFPFLAGTRPSEQLGLLWSEVNFDKGTIHICRVQERDGSLSEMTKTEAGTREIPMGPLLGEMLLAWRERCPRKDGQLHRVFGGPGRLQPWPKPRIAGGGALLYQNFRRRYWEPIFKKLELPYCTPHAARHAYVSVMQAQGIEVALVSKIVGHANPNVTLGIYSQAVRGGEAAVAALERAYSGQATTGG